MLLFWAHLFLFTERCFDQWRVNLWCMLICERECSCERGCQDTAMHACLKILPPCWTVLLLMVFQFLWTSSQQRISRVKPPRLSCWMIFRYLSKVLHYNPSLLFSMHPLLTPLVLFTAHKDVSFTNFQLRYKEFEGYFRKLERQICSESCSIEFERRRVWC